MNSTARTIIGLVIGLVLSCPQAARAQEVALDELFVGHTFTLESAVLRETRRINVYTPGAYAGVPDARFPVLYMPDGGIHEDFLHIAGLVQISSLNRTMRPFVLVGIENTDRRRDLTGRTSVASDREIAERVGGSADFRRFIEAELMPAIDSSFRTSGETAIIGESLAGLFVVETLLEAPALFDTYIAVDPSLWWDDQRLVRDAVRSLQGVPASDRPTLHLAASSQTGIVEPTEALAKALAEHPDLVCTTFTEYPDETHLSIFHPAALDGLRLVLSRDRDWQLGTPAWSEDRPRRCVGEG